MDVAAIAQTYWVSDAARPTPRAHRELVNIDGIEVMLDKAWAGPSVRAALRSGSYERAERGVLAAKLSPDDTYLELGSGIVVLATLAAGRVGDGNVVAVEADPVIAAVARETALRNGHVIDVRNVVLLTLHGGGSPQKPVTALSAGHTTTRPGSRRSSISFTGCARRG